MTVHVFRRTFDHARLRRHITSIHNIRTVTRNSIRHLNRLAMASRTHVTIPRHRHSKRRRMSQHQRGFHNQDHQDTMRTNFRHTRTMTRNRLVITRHLCHAFLTVPGLSTISTNNSLLAMHTSILRSQHTSNTKGTKRTFSTFRSGSSTMVSRVVPITTNFNIRISSAPVVLSQDHLVRRTSKTSHVTSRRTFRQHIKCRRIKSTTSRTR